MLIQDLQETPGEGHQGCPPGIPSTSDSPVGMDQIEGMKSMGSTPFETKRSRVDYSGPGGSRKGKVHRVMLALLPRPVSVSKVEGGFRRRRVSDPVTPVDS